MAQRSFDIDGVGQVMVCKRKGSKNLRLSVNSKNQVRVTLPVWLPYSAGVSFAATRKDWIAKHAHSTPTPLLKNGDRIGKSYRLRFAVNPKLIRLSARLEGNEIIVRVPTSASVVSTQQTALRACEKALRAEAENLLPQRLSHLALRHNFNYQSLRIKKLTGRWGSCSSTSQIALSYYLVQLPWQLVDYVIIHELVHTKHLNHGTAFWTEFKRILPEARELQKRIKQYKPVVQSSI